MKIFKKDKSLQERRKYIRLNSVFPVQFQILTLDEAGSLSGCLQGFTNNVGKGGICLQVNNLIPALAQPLKDRQAKLSLDIQMPLTGKSVKATAKVAWIQNVAGCPNGYLVGLSYEKIDPLQNSRLMHYAWAKKIIIPALLGAIIILGLGFALNTFINAKLIKGNITLVEELVNIVQKSSIAKQKVKAINKQREDLQVKIQALDLQIRTAGDEIKSSAKNKKELTNLLEQLNREKETLQEKLITIQADETVITEDLLQLDRIKTTLEKANVEKMYQWVKAHQSPHTGLVVSLAGKTDADALAFTYEQALAAQAYTNFSDFERVRKLFNFFSSKAKRINGQFLNTYFADSGMPAQDIAQSKANISLGIAIMQYTYKTKDSRYLNLAEEIAAKIIALQQKDKDGGIASDDISGQYYTKDNLDGYAFFTMLNKITGKKQYAEAAAKVLNWLLNNTYDKNGIRIAPARPDIITDTYAWSIAAVGPQELEALGINPERIIEFAEANCSIKTCYIRPGGRTVNVKGFDFSAGKGTAGSGIITSEWTAQMVIAYKIMADYYYQKGMIAKGRSYALKSGDLMNELDNMIISSASLYSKGESCLPYASEDVVETSGGTRILRSKSSGCVAGTVYTVFAYYNYNPLILQD